MKSLIANFSTQLEDALVIGGKARLTKYPKPFSSVLIVGMGGSGIAGTVISELVSHQSKIPILVSKTYFLPAYVGKNTLVIISSYSGNTEEVVEAIKHAIKRGAQVVCIASGGELLTMARKKHIDYVVVPAGMPPRSCFGYLLVQMFFILHNFGIITDKFKADFRAVIALIQKEEKNIQAEAKKVAKILFKKTPVIYVPVGYEGVSVRFRQQLNENSKILALHHVIPEMNHNEILGWRTKDKNLAVVIFRNDSDYSRVQKRIDFTKKVIRKYTPHIVEIHSKGHSIIERSLYHIHMGDWVSFFLSEMRKVDPTEIEVIESLKVMLKNL